MWDWPATQDRRQGALAEEGEIGELEVEFRGAASDDGLDSATSVLVNVSALPREGMAPLRSTVG